MRENCKSVREGQVGARISATMLPIVGAQCTNISHGKKDIHLRVEYINIAALSLLRELLKGCLVTQAVRTRMTL
jgi:hypothetical protein